MRSISVVLVLLITQLTSWVSCAESSEELTNSFLKDLKQCPGGYCIKGHLCTNGSINTDGDHILEPRMDDRDESDPVDVEFEQAGNPCEEFLLRCCALESVSRSLGDTVAAEPEGPLFMPPPSCGANYPGGYVLRVKDRSIAQFGEFPWMAALMQETEVLDKKHLVNFCGGSLIHPKVVLTAAHCMTNQIDVDAVLVRLGEWDTVTENEPLIHQDIRVQKVIIHERYVDRKFHNDLALLILDDEAVLNNHINPICLPTSDDNFDNLRCMVSGWGKENFNPAGKYSEVLKKVELPVVPRAECKRMFKASRLGPFFQLHSSFMCAGGEPEVDVCKGDGGSPLACKIEDRFIQAGIVSWGLGCGENGIPGAYAKVSNFVDWITTTLQKEAIEI